MTEKEILENIYNNAKKLDVMTISEVVKEDVNILIENIESNKSLLCALVTSLLKK